LLIELIHKIKIIMDQSENMKKKKLKIRSSSIEYTVLLRFDHICILNNLIKIYANDGYQRHFFTAC